MRAAHISDRDVLIVAGDVSTELTHLRRALSLLASFFPGKQNDSEDDEAEGGETPVRMSNVFFCPGNNELRLARSDKSKCRTSLDKLTQVLQVCNETGVRTDPCKVNDDVYIIPLWAWYTPQFDPNWSGDLVYRRGWLDFRACVWPPSLDSDVDGISTYFLNQNEQRLAHFSSPMHDAPVVSFSHFLPRFDVRLLHRSTCSTTYAISNSFCLGVCSFATRICPWSSATRVWTTRYGG